MLSLTFEVINCWAKSKEPDAASKAEEMLVAMSRLHSSGIPNLKPDAFTYTAVIDAWAKSGYRGAASRADQLLDKMEAKYLAGDMDLKPNTFTYNAVSCCPRRWRFPKRRSIVSVLNFLFVCLYRLSMP